MNTNAKNIELTTKSVINVYKRVNPSFIEDIHNKKEEYFFKWITLISNKLKVPPSFFKNCDLLDVGCGTGEKTLVYAYLGAKVIGLDANEKAIALAKKLLIRQERSVQKRVQFRTCSIFKINLNQYFDAIVCDGVVHHTANPKKAFNNFARLLKPGGILLLGLADPCAFFQRQLQRYFVNKITDNGDEKIKIEVATVLFGKTLKKASAISGRSIKAGIYDSFINPCIKPVAFYDVKKWMEDFDIHLDCTWPPSDLPLQSNSQYHPTLDFSHKAVLGWESLTLLHWLLNNEKDQVRFGSFNNYSRRINSFINEVSSICTDFLLNRNSLKKIIENFGDIKITPLPSVSIKNDFIILIREILKIDRQIDNMRGRGFKPEDIAKKLRFKRIFKGFSGVGMIYYRGTKNIDSKIYA